MILIIILTFFNVAVYAQPVRSDYLSVELISANTSVRPGETFDVALKIQLDKGWHVYWKNPGDAGMPVSIEWDLPAGFSAGQIRWPFPRLIKSAHLANFAYADEVLLLVPVTLPYTLPADTNIVLKAQAKWLVCKEDCTPGNAALSLTLPVRDQPSTLDARYVDDFYRAKFNLPLTESSWFFSSTISDSFLWINAASRSPQFNTIKNARFFPLAQEVIKNAADQIFIPETDGFTLKIPLDLSTGKKPDKLDGVIVSDSGWRGVNSERGHEVHFNYEFDETEFFSYAGVNSFIIAIIFAFLGGLILNLMPCVLPVLSIKILSFVKQSNGDKNETFKHGLLFSAGVMFSFWALAVILLFLQSAGEHIGWGYQLQNPVFLFLLILFFFLFGLNLFGVFEFGVTFGALNIKGADRRDLLGSFINGMIATLVATPCTAPFMGSALGYAVTRPPVVALAVFTFLGLGMSSPYLLLSAKPSWLKFLPRPGTWMESLKQFFGFLLMGTAIWLLWVMSLQEGKTMVIRVLFALLIIGIGAWAYGRWGGPDKRKGLRRGVSLLFILTILSTFWVITVHNGENTVKGASMEKILWQKYSKMSFEKALNSDRPVFIDFTAAWCLSCQVNEKVALDVKKVQKRFNDLQIIAFKADWTNRDDEIGEALSAYGRNSVPLYVLYGKDRTNPIFLPEIITPGIVLNALKKIRP